MILTKETNLYQLDAISDGIASGAANAVSNYDQNVLDQTKVFNKLTNNGQAQGIFMRNGELYINMSYLQTGTLKLGGANNGDGLLEVYNQSGQRIGRWDNSGIYIGNIQSNLTDPMVQISSGGVLTAKSTTLSRNFDMVTTHGGKVHLGEGATFHTEGGTTTTYYYPIFTFYEEGGWSNGDRVKISSKEIQVIAASQLDVITGAIIQPQRLALAMPISSTSTDYEFDVDSDYASFDVGRPGRSYTSKFYGTLTVTGTKSRSVSTDDYGDRLLYCYETPSPLFGDVGEGTISNDGKCYVMIDNIFAETVNLLQYQVLLQKYGSGDCWVSERKSAYFVVEGTPGLSFGWELKAKQSDFDQLRLERNQEPVNTSNIEDYADLLTKHLYELRREREVA